VPDDLSDELVAPVNCALSQVIYGLRRAGLGFGDTVVMQGAGGLGLNAIAVARESGAAKIIAVDSQAARLALAAQFGADATVNINEVETPERRIAAVKELTDGRGADVVCDFAGFPAVIPEGLEMLRNGGTYLEIGHISTGVIATIEPSRVVFGSKRLIGIYHYDPWTIPAALEFLQRTRQKYPFERIVSHKFPLESIDQAFSEAEWLNRGSNPTAVTRAVIAW
jgi:L-iditol 2-dehydrogenase